MGALTTFKLGPIHDGRRELAFSNHGWSKVITAVDIADEGVRRNLSRWLVGEGFIDPKPDPSCSIQYGLEQTNERYTAHDSDYLFEVKRRPYDLELIIYTSKPWQVSKWGDVTPIDSFLKEAVGTFVYEKGLGKVKINKMDELPRSANVVTIKGLYSRCEELLPPKQKAFIDRIVVDTPCVVGWSAPLSWTERLIGIVRRGEANPYMKSRKSFGIGELMR
jgi:hypothetical protein